MPRRIAQTLPSTLSRLLQGNYLKRAPLVMPVLALHPPAPLPPRAPVPRSDLRPLAQPSLAPRKITYLEDRVRRRFFHDHPWEAARPRSLTEAQTTSEIISRPGPVDLRNWGSDPSAEDVVSCVVALVRSEGLSLSMAYHHTLSTFYALRAAHEHRTRAAVMEAVAYGATFPVRLPWGEVAESGGARESARFHARERRAVEEGMAHLQNRRLSSAGGAVGVGGPSGAATDAPAARSDEWAGGKRYLEASLRARDGSPAPAAPAQADQIAEPPTSHQAVAAAHEAAKVAVGVR